MARPQEPALDGAQDTVAIVGRAFACSPEVAAQVIRRGRVRCFPGQATILRQGDWLNLAYVMILGRARALLYSADGQIVLLQWRRAFLRTIAIRISAKAARRKR